MSAAAPWRLAACPSTFVLLTLHLVYLLHNFELESVFQPSPSSMHFPTLPKRWRLPAASAEAKKPPKSSTRVTTPRKINPINNNSSKLSRSVSFNSDNVFKVPAIPSCSSSSTASTRLSRSMSRPRHYEAAGEEAKAAACPNCQYQSRQDWRSRSLIDLQRQPQSASVVPSSATAATTASRSSSLVRLNPSMQQTTSPRGCENQKLSTSSNNIATIFSNNLRSNSWRNLSVIGQHTNTETGAREGGYCGVRQMLSW